MREAMRWRRRVMATRCSVRAARVPGADGLAAGAAGRVAGAAALAGAAFAVPCLSRYSTTSVLVRRPSRPDAGMPEGSSLFSSTRRRTDGLSLLASVGVPPPFVAADGCGDRAAVEV